MSTSFITDKTITKKQFKEMLESKHLTKGEPIDFRIDEEETYKDNSSSICLEVVAKDKTDYKVWADHFIKEGRDIVGYGHLFFNGVDNSLVEISRYGNNGTAVECILDVLVYKTPITVFSEHNELWHLSLDPNDKETIKVLKEDYNIDDPNDITMEAITESEFPKPNVLGGSPFHLELI